MAWLSLVFVERQIKKVEANKVPLLASNDTDVNLMVATFESSFHMILNRVLRSCVNPNLSFFRSDLVIFAPSVHPGVPVRNGIPPSHSHESKSIMTGTSCLFSMILQGLISLWFGPKLWR